MSFDALEAYRRCDPATDRIDDLGVFDPMLRRRLESLARPADGIGAGRTARSPGSASRRPWIFIVVGCAAALVLGGLVVTTADDGHGPPSGVAPEPVVIAGSPTDAPGEPREDVAELRALATDAVADDFVAAVNAASVDGALALLSPESDCHEPMRPDAAQETCDRYWSRQMSIDADVSLIDCDGIASRRCSLLIRSELTHAGSTDRSRTRPVDLGLDDEHRLEFGWAEAPANR